ncbi:hypothetical protein chiPu_0032735 [Chiloscyllium punctatum]|uniref:Uncharacterized protein n=1 Tax=Chiloscyllium punctatum TaxID=137246 RepID=A0A401U0Y6_CHIPU|nr:hypothetical protein [Chiloscyllium punctatum]
MEVWDNRVSADPGPKLGAWRENGQEDEELRPLLASRREGSDWVEEISAVALVSPSENRKRGLEGSCSIISDSIKAGSASGEPERQSVMKD